MGIQHSQLLIGEVIDASKGSTSDEEFNFRLVSIWYDKTPSEVRKSIGDILNIPIAKTQSRIWTPSTTSIATIELDKEIKSSVLVWKRNPEAFFQDTSYTPDFSDGLVGMYTCMTHSERKILQNRIRQRLLAVTFGRLKQLFPQKDSDWTLLAQHICSRLDGDEVERPGDVAKKISGRGNIGGRYDVLISELGNSDVLLALPQNIGDSIWEHHLPIEGPQHKTLVWFLKNRGILEAAEGCHGVTDVILSFLWDKVINVVQGILVGISLHLTVPLNQGEKRQRRRRQHPSESRTRDEEQGDGHGPNSSGERPDAGEPNHVLIVQFSPTMPPTKRKRGRGPAPITKKSNALPTPRPDSHELSEDRISHDYTQQDHRIRSDQGADQSNAMQNKTPVPSCHWDALGPGLNVGQNDSTGASVPTSWDMLLAAANPLPSADNRSTYDLMMNPPHQPPGSANTNLELDLLDSTENEGSFDEMFGQLIDCRYGDEEEEAGQQTQ